MNRRIAISDIHGCFKTLKELLETVVEFRRTDELYLLGDYVDRGPASCQVLEYLIELNALGYKLFPLMGNHEDMMHNALENENELDIWFDNGAQETLKSYGIPNSGLFNHPALKRIPQKHIDFISNLPCYRKLDNYLLVHAGFNFFLKDIFSDRSAMLWTRKSGYVSSKTGNKTIIHGHTPTPVAVIKDQLEKRGTNLINIDAGCVYKHIPGYGHLIALDIDSRQLFIQKNID
jgi:serine/threonine protein phosphatase 1